VCSRCGPDLQESGSGLGRLTEVDVVTLGDSLEDRFRSFLVYVVEETVDEVVEQFWTDAQVDELDATTRDHYVHVLSLTVGPLMQEGVGFREAVTDALYSETPSITVMEIVAIGSDLLIASQAHITDALCWASLALSLSFGFLAAFPENAALVNFGVKEGMKNPAEMGKQTRVAS